MTAAALTLASIAVFAVVLAATGILLRLLKRRAIVALPNERSSHAVPTPQGGGWAIIPVLAAVWVAIAWMTPESGFETGMVCGLALALGALSWLDDLRGLSPLWRLLAQAVVVSAALAVMPRHAPYFAGLLPGPLDLLAAGLLWVWFINLFNFMDGIDGIAAVETACIGVGTAVVSTIAGFAGSAPAYGLTAAAAALGFLRWNWHPARIFLGDVGSVPLGFMLGWLLLSLAAGGQWMAAFILPLFYLADASLTLIRRALRRQPVWRAHREHFYQRPVQRGVSHRHVVVTILIANIVLLGLAAWAATGHGLPAGAAAILVVTLLLIRLATLHGSPPGASGPAS